MQMLRMTMVMTKWKWKTKTAHNSFLKAVDLWKTKPFLVAASNNNTLICAWFLLQIQFLSPNMEGKSHPVFHPSKWRAVSSVSEWVSGGMNGRPSAMTWLAGWLTTACLQLTWPKHTLNSSSSLWVDDGAWLRLWVHGNSPRLRLFTYTDYYCRRIKKGKNGIRKKYTIVILCFIF